MDPHSYVAPPPPPLGAPLRSSEDDKDVDKKSRRREQNRLSAQRSYHKKQERLQSLRCQVSHLEAQYQHQVSTIASSSSTPSVSSAPPSDASAAHSPPNPEWITRAASPVGSPPPQSTSSPRSSAFQTLLADRAKLQSENDALRRRIDEQARFQFRLQSLSVGDDDLLSSSSSSSTNGGGMTLVHNSVTGSPRFVPRITMKRPLTVEECYAISSSAYQRIRRYKFPEQGTIQGSPMFGWANKRVMEEDGLKVQLRKVFAHHDADTVARVSWTAVQDPRTMDALYSINMNMHSEITQRIDDNNVVMYQSYETPERDAQGHETGAVCVMHHVMLLSFFQTETGYVIVFCSLEPDRLDESDHIVDLAEEEEAVARGVVKRRRKLWFKKFSWFAMDYTGAHHASTDCMYMFTVPGHHGVTFYWPLEILLLILRYEMAAVGPTILLPPSDDCTIKEEEEENDSNDGKPLVMLDAVMAEEEGEEVEEEEEEELVDDKLKIEPLIYDGGNGDRLRSSSGVDDMDQLFVELFP